MTMTMTNKALAMIPDELLERRLTEMKIEYLGRLQIMVNEKKKLAKNLTTLNRELARRKKSR